MTSAIARLQSWYRAQCDGEWERSFGVHIQTTKRGSWLVKIDLSETILVEDDFTEVTEGLPYSASWISCRVVGTQFEGMGDAKRLDEILEHFLMWASNRPDWLSVPPSETQEDADHEFWISLGNEIGPEKCRFEGCSRKHIASSVLCRPHHYKMLRGVPCPFETNSEAPGPSAV